MSLAMYAAPFDNDNNELYNNELYKNSANDTPINRKRNIHNKTQKRNSLQENNSQKVNTVLETIHNTYSNEDSELGDYRLIPPPMSVGVENTKLRENMQNQNNEKDNDVQANEKDDVDLEEGIKKFEEGMKTVKELKEYLEKMENKIKELKKPS